ncbi:MAG: protein-export membrane protein SecG (preprotein translocase subunit) [uncultured bacterium]|nr:MAG: protein-export membrane protein SecG (preprotein translocase subunit) [uncultured bacterium]
MYQLILIIHMFAAVSLIALVLVQQGKGATMGAAFGSGASQTVFGSRGAGSFLLKVTIGFVIVFFATSISLNYLASSAAKQSQQMMLPLPGQQPDATLPPVSPSSIPLSVPTDSLKEQPVQSGKTNNRN